MPPKVAAVTMSYNETAYLPLWTRHYARQVGADHCYVVDHGSTEPLVVPPGVNILRLPRSPHDDLKRALFISSLVEGLLEYYDWVSHTDVAELVMADPGRYPDLPSFCDQVQTDAVTAVGLDIQHIPLLEPPLDTHRAVGEQRHWVRFTSAMCKPVLTRKPLVWSPGFHCADTPLNFGGLYLFHLHWADLTIGIQRLEKTRTMPWRNQVFGAHQRVTNAQWTGTFDGMTAFERQDDIAFDLGQTPLASWLHRTTESAINRERDRYSIDLHVNAGELWAIPPAFRARL
jgi:hypothetical protein